MSAVLLPILVICFIIMFVVVIYNSLVNLKNQYINALSQIDVQLKRRYDLIPNLVEAVKGYMNHERGTLEAVIAARNSALSALKCLSQGPANPELFNKLIQSENTLKNELARFNVAIEQYPELKAGENVRLLQEELTSTENRLAFARQAYNDAVMTYNNKKEMFPSNIVAGFFHFPMPAYWMVSEEVERNNVKVSLT